MKDFLRQQANQATNELLKRSIVREYLQARTLQVIQESGAFMNWAFLGGTALRFLYSIPRYSEDLDRPDCLSCKKIATGVNTAVQDKPDIGQTF